MTLSKLIDKQDNFELIRDQIAAILATETASQQALATAGGKDPNLWKFNVYTERSRPWEIWQRTRSSFGVDKAPIVNVWYDSSSFLQNRSNTAPYQLSDSTFNIGIIAEGRCKVRPAGQDTGDEEAAREVQRIVRLVRNIIMSGEYRYLSLRGLVQQRWLTSMTMMNVEAIDGTQQTIAAAQLSLSVHFNELTAEVDGVALEQIGITINRAEDGQVLVAAEYDYT